MWRAVKIKYGIILSCDDNAFIHSNLHDLQCFGEVMSKNEVAKGTYGVLNGASPSGVDVTVSIHSCWNTYEHIHSPSMCRFCHQMASLNTRTQTFQRVPSALQRRLLVLTESASKTDRRVCSVWISTSNRVWP